jgi:hypothetical protein
VALARAKPGTLQWYAAAGNSDFIMAGFLKSMNLQVAKVPYRDIMQAPNDLAEGRIQLLMASYAAMRPLIQAGKLKVLAVTSRKRAGIASDIPTVAEAGFPFLGLDSLIIFGPRGTPNAVRESIAADIKAIVAADPTIATRLEATGQVVDIRGPAELPPASRRCAIAASIAQALGGQGRAVNGGPRRTLSKPRATGAVQPPKRKLKPARTTLGFCDIDECRAQPGDLRRQTTSRAPKSE